MKTIASIESYNALTLMERLKQAAIPFKVETTTLESGIDYSDILVDDVYFDRACDVAEAWQDDRSKEAARHCKNCGSINMEYVCEGDLGESVWRCNDCEKNYSQSTH